MSTVVRTHLWVMMFLEFFIWGAWYVTMGTYLNKLQFSGSVVGNAYATTSIAAIVAPFFIGMVADRFFSAQKVLGVLHLVGAGLLYLTSTITDAGPFYWSLLAYTICYMPTLALVNAIAMKQMADPAKEFPGIRVLGTIGWIVAGIFIGYMAVEDTAIPMQVGALASLVLGVYSFFLPNTPPSTSKDPVTISDILGLKALGLMRNPSFAIFVVSSLLICIPLAFYYNFTNLFLTEMNVTNAAGKMTMGQMSEIAFMLVMPFFFIRLGVKYMLVVGMLAWTARYFLFAYGNGEELVYMLYLGILLHGICYDFFFVTGQLYVDREAPEEVRASAQGFIAFITYGVGMFIGSSLVSGRVVEHYQISEGEKIVGHHWDSIWIVPAIMALVITVLFFLVFRDKKADQATA